MKSESRGSDDLDRWFYEVFGGGDFTGKSTQQKRSRVTPEMEREILEIAAEAEAKEAKAARKARPIKIATFEC
jgi:hypothetical protein